MNTYRENTSLIAAQVNLKNFKVFRILTLILTLVKIVLLEK